MTRGVLDYSNPTKIEPSARYKRGIRIGRWALYTSATLPVAAVFIIPFPFVLVTAFCLALASVVLTRYRTVCGWIAFAITAPLTILSIFGLCSVLWEKNNPPTAPVLMPQGFSHTYYSMPKLDPADIGSIQTQGINAGGHLHSLRVTNVNPDSLLATGYGLRSGDIITSYNSWPISDVDDLKVITARVISAARIGAKYKVQRDGNWLYLTNGHPPVEARPGLP